MSRLYTVTFIATALCAANLQAQDNPFSADAKQAYTGIKGKNRSKTFFTPSCSLPIHRCNQESLQLPSLVAATS